LTCQAEKFYGETFGLLVAAFMGKVGWMEFGEKEGTHLAINLWRSRDPARHVKAARRSCLKLTMPT